MSTICSASGKVLLAGGYLVLDPAYHGLVVATSSRFYTTVSSSSTPGIVVRSPQFLDARWVYSVEIASGGPRILEQDLSSKNKFVRVALQETLTLAWEVFGRDETLKILHHGLDIIIGGGNDFYSQREQLSKIGLPPTTASLAQLPSFASTGKTLGDVHKTGLGSSAALITSLVSALLIHLGLIPQGSLLDSDIKSEHRALVHNTSQFIHCLAQGKVGSGFDVASAVYGSHRYTRFNPDIISPIMGDLATRPALRPILSPSATQWDHHVDSFRLPPHTRLMLADVDAGSDTPSLVGKVLKWRKENAIESKELWDSIAEANSAFLSTLEALSHSAERDLQGYQQELSRCISLTYSEWTRDAHPIASQLAAVYEASKTIRDGMHHMGTLAGVPIEPPEQTRLLDACSALPGVIAGGVPGAGGYDAIWFLVIDPPKTSVTSPAVLDTIEAVWLGWEEMNVSPLAAVEHREGHSGVREERMEDVPGLAELHNRK